MWWIDIHEIDVARWASLRSHRLSVTPVPSCAYSTNWCRSATRQSSTLQRLLTACIEKIVRILNVNFSWPQWNCGYWC